MHGDLAGEWEQQKNEARTSCAGSNNATMDTTPSLGSHKEDR